MQMHACMHPMPSDLMGAAVKQRITHAVADEWNPSTDRILITGRLSKEWRSASYWIDLAPGAEVELPVCQSGLSAEQAGVSGGVVVFRCVMDCSSEDTQLRLIYSMDGQEQEISTMLGAFLNLTTITGFPCFVIPRLIKSASHHRPAAVMLEFATRQPC